MILVCQGYNKVYCLDLDEKTIFRSKLFLELLEDKFYAQQSMKF